MLSLLLTAVLTAAQNPLDGADQRIDQYRKGDVEMIIVDSGGRAVRDAEVTIRQTRHSFLFGANIFALFKNPPEKEELYRKRFTDLLNYATIGFYWGAYEPTQGKPNDVFAKRVAEWCAEHGIETKGHPLVWHEVWPSWAPKTAAEAKPLIEKRVKETVKEFAGLVDRWDVVNEATVSARFENGVGDWAKSEGASKMVDQCVRWAHSANAKSDLLYNDFNVGKDYESLVGYMLQEDVPVDAIGIQSHMHSAEWPLQRVWDVCETYRRFGMPIHFTEVTVLSGEHMKGGDYKTRREDWKSTEEGEKRQAEYVRDFYKLLFSHPLVQAITWWDLMDGGWLGAPGGLVRADMSPKPAYDELMKLIKGEWWTVEKMRTNESGRVKFRGFGGDYEVVTDLGRGAFTVEPRKLNRLRVMLK